MSDVFDASVIEKIHEVKDVLTRLKEQVDNQDRRELEREVQREKLWAERMKPLVDMTAVHNRTLFGDGSEGYPGLYKEVDRIKQRNVLINWALGIISTPPLAYVGKKVIDFFRS